jgi:hypothetical protein
MLDVKRVVDETMELDVVPSFTDVGLRVRSSLRLWEPYEELTSGA